MSFDVELCNRKDGPIHGYFSLSYANYLVLPRSVLQETPLEWQQRFVDLMKELCDNTKWLDPGYIVTARGAKGRFDHDPLSSYRYPEPNITQWSDTWKTPTQMPFQSTLD